MAEREWYSTQHVAQLVGMTSQWVRRQIDAGRLNARYFDGAGRRTYRIHRTDLRDFLRRYIHDSMDEGDDLLPRRRRYRHSTKTQQSQRNDHDKDATDATLATNRYRLAGACPGTDQVAFRLDEAKGARRWRAWRGSVSARRRGGRHVQPRDGRLEAHSRIETREGPLEVSARCCGDRWAVRVIRAGREGSGLGPNLGAALLAALELSCVDAEELDR